MAVEVKVPSPGESVTEGRIAQWYAKNGASVKVDDPLFELESDKAAQTVTAQTAGVLSIGVAEGATVQVGAVVGSIDPSGAPAPAAKPAPAATTSAAPAEGRSSPSARALMEESGAAVSNGSGPRGVVTKDDVLASLSSKSAPPPSAPPPPPKPAATTTAPKPAPVADGQRETRQPMSMIRKRTAERLLESQNTTATLTTFNEADMSAIMELRAKYNEKFEKKYGAKLGFMSVFVKAAVEALKAFPLVNSRIDGNDIVIQHFYDVGVAVSSEKGLFVPVLRGADKLGFADIEKSIGDLAKRARDGKITVNDMMGGTFTITNGGVFGSMLSTPILNPPQTAILGMHSIQKRAVVVNDQIVVRPMMFLALSYDHRLIDGKDAVQFLVRIKECVENPERMLLGI